MKSPKIPSPPSAASVASAQTGSNQSTAMFEQMLNMQDQRNPYGSLTWQSAGTWQYTDPTTGKVMTVPKFMASTVLSPEQQGLLDQEQQFDARWNDMALAQTDRVREALSKPFDYSPGIHEKWASDLYDKLNSPTIARQQDELQQQLANRGLNYGTAAYDQGMKDFYEGNQRARDAFMLDSYGTGLNTALTIRNQPLKEGAALMSGGQITEPQWISGPQSGVANTDIAGISANNYSQQVARAQAQQQSQAGFWGALGQIGGAALGGWLSDKRVKKNIHDVGTDPDTGLRVKEWEYKDGSESYRTPIAQDVEKRFPHAVSTVNGVKRVNWRSIPGGEKFEQEMESGAKPYYYGPGGQRGVPEMPEGYLYGGRNMRNPGDDPNWSIKKALPKTKRQEARFGGALSRLGARSAA